MRWRSTLLLLFLNLSLLIWFFFAPSKSEIASQAKNFPSKEFLTDITLIAISHKQRGTTYRFEQSENQWKMKQPFVWPANTFAIESLLNQLRVFDPKIAFSLEDIKKSGQSLQHYGLQEPEIILTLENKDKKFHLHFGFKAPLGNRCYLFEPETQQVMVGEQRYFDALYFKENQWCDTRLFPVGFKAINTLSFKHSQQHLFMTKEGGQWFLKNPVAAKASNARTELLLGQLQSLEILRFLNEEEQKQFKPKLNDEQTSCALTITGEQASHSLKLTPYAPEETIYAAKIDNYEKIFLFRSNLVERLLNPQETLRERTVFSFDPREVNKLSYRNGKEQITFQCIENDRWEIFKYHEQNLVQTDRASAKKIRWLLENLTELTVEEFLVDLPGAKASAIFEQKETPASYLSLQLKDRVLECLIVQRDEGIYLKFKEEPAVFRLTLASTDLFLIQFSQYQEKFLWKWNKTETIQSLEWISLYSFQRLSYKAGKQGQEAITAWLTSLDLGKEQKEALSWMIKATRHFKVGSFLSLYFDQVPLGWFNHSVQFLWPYQLKITTQDSNNQLKVYQLHFSQRLNGTRQLGSVNNRLFLLNQKWIDALFYLTEWPYWQRMAFLLNPLP